LAVDADAYGVCVEVAFADDERGADFALFGGGDLGFDGVVREVGVGADAVAAELGNKGLGVIHERGFLGAADRQDGELLGD
jgi:hypothetical protein